MEAAPPETPPQHRAADHADRNRRGAERGPVGPVHDPGGSVVHRRRSDAADSSTPDAHDRGWRCPKRNRTKRCWPISRRSSSRCVKCLTRSSAIARDATFESSSSLTARPHDARRLADVRYRGRATSYLEVLDSDTRMFSAELGVTEAELRELLSLVQVYRALGGGWQS